MPVNFFPPLVAFVITVLGIHLLTPLAIKLGLIDTPQGRKQHMGQVPLIGGISMFLGFLFALLTLPISLVNYRSFIASSALLVLVGILDDFHELTPRSRFVAQIIAVMLMMVWGNILITYLGFLSKPIVLHHSAWGFTLLAGVGLINAINMIDGVDGLAGGLTLIAFSFLILIAIQAGQWNSVFLLSLLIAVILAFLLFNFPWYKRLQARVFMGDAGSMFLGFALVWFLIQLSQSPIYAVTPVTMLWIVAVPLFDIGGVIIRRIQKKTSLFIPDREHIHYVLLSLGFSQPQVTYLLCGSAVLMGAIGFLANELKWSESWMLIIFLSLFFSYLLGLVSVRRHLAAGSE